MSTLDLDHAARSQFAALLAGSPLGVVILDHNLDIVLSAGSRAHELPSGPELRAIATYVRDTGESTSDGSVTCYPIRRGEELVGIGCVLEAANRIRDQFLSVLSHELRVPLTTLLLWERLLHEQSEQENRDRALAAIRQSAQTLSRLINELVDGSRAISGKLRIDQRSVSADHLLAHAIEHVQDRFAAKKVVLVRDVQELGTCFADTARLRQAFEYVLLNALELTPSGGRVHVTGRLEDEQILITVRDGGRGVPSGLLVHMFEPFTQLAEGLPRSDGDLGLGLSTARAVIELHDGSIEATTPHVDQGSVFTIKLPAMPGPAEIDQKRLAAGALANLDVLLVDDDPDVLSAMRMLLEVMGARVRCERSGASAVVALVTKVPDVMLCDVFMPGEDGNALIRRIRQLDEPVCRVRAIALSGAAKDADGHISVEAGFDRHLPKPVDVDRLVTTIQELTRPS